MPNENSNYRLTHRSRMTLGTVSLGLLGLIFVSFLPLALLSAQPQYQGPSGLGVGIVMGMLLVFFWLPLLVASFATGGMAIVNDRGRKQGIIAVCIALLYLLSLFLM